MFEHFRQSLRDLMDRSTPPEERRAGLAQMKQTLVQARMGLDDLRKGIEQTRQRIASEQRELDTVRRRKGLAAGINDQETVSLAEKYESLHAERTEVLTRKLAAQESELALVEREVGEMTSALKGALSGATTTPLEGVDTSELDSMLDGGAGVAEEIDAMGRASSRSAREAEADRLLAELKRRMGK
jgi:predicted  nucleic acid-binding Zn-ribbon protein